MTKEYADTLLRLIELLGQHYNETADTNAPLHAQVAVLVAKKIQLEQQLAGTSETSGEALH